MIADGLLVPEYPYLRDDHLREPKKYQGLLCTRDQMTRYRDKDGQWAVEVFQYLRPDKTLGASGKPDPKRLRIGNTVFIVDRQGRT